MKLKLKYFFLIWKWMQRWIFKFLLGVVKIQSLRGSIVENSFTFFSESLICCSAHSWGTLRSTWRCITLHSHLSCYSSSCFILLPCFAWKIFSCTRYSRRSGLLLSTTLRPACSSSAFCPFLLSDDVGFSRYSTRSRKTRKMPETKFPGK